MSHSPVVRLFVFRYILSYVGHVSLRENKIKNLVALSVLPIKRDGQRLDTSDELLCVWSHGCRQFLRFLVHIVGACINLLVPCNLVNTNIARIETYIPKFLPFSSKASASAWSLPSRSAHSLLGFLSES